MMPPCSDLRLTWDDDLGSLGSSGVHLRQLLPQVPGAGVFCTPEWLFPAARHLLKETARLRVLSATQDGQLVACLPLVLDREHIHGLGVRSLRLLGDPLADRSPLLVSPAAPELMDATLDTLWSHRDEWDVTILSELPEDERGRSRIDHWCARHDIAHSWRLCGRAPILELNHPDAAAVRAAYSRTLRTRLRRARKKLGAAGKVTVERMRPAPDEIEPLLAEIKRIEDDSWKGQAGQGIFSKEHQVTFFHDVSRRFAANRWLEITLLRLNEVPISYRYGFRYEDVFFDYNLAYLPRFRAFSPGRVLLEEVILGGHADGLRAIDASRGSLTTGHILQDWTRTHMNHYQLWIFGSSVRGQALRFALMHLKPLVKSFVLRIGRN